jgi:uncharacterized metal-binding protein
MLDLNQIMRELSSMVGEQGEVIGTFTRSWDLHVCPLERWLFSICWIWEAYQCITDTNHVSFLYVNSWFIGFSVGGFTLSINRLPIRSCVKRSQSWNRARFKWIEPWRASPLERNYGNQPLTFHR